MYRATLQSNVQSSQGRGAKGKNHAQSHRARRKDGRGFTLIELLIVITIIPLIVGALAGGLLEVFSLQSGTANRLADSADAQVIAATFTKDVQAATTISTSPTPLTQCGSGTSLLELQFGTTEVVSYSEQLQSGTTYSLARNDCPTGPSGTLSSTVISYDILPPCPITDSLATCTSSNLQAAPVAYDGSTVVNTTSPAGVTTVGMTSLQFPIVEPNSTYTYQLSATPAGGASTAETNLGLPSNGSTCGFALPGTGEFSTTMCFIGFTTTQLQAAYTSTGTLCTAKTDGGVSGEKGVDTSVNVPGGYTMTFCLSVAPGEGGTNPPPIVAATTPIGGGTCDPPPRNTGCDLGSRSNGQGFLGNDNQVNGTATPFYAGIGCPLSTPVLQSNVVTSSCISPAIFQTSNGGLDTVTLSNIQVTDPDGTSATGYEVITADAETIDPGGFIKWSSSLPASKPLPFNLVPNFTDSDLGNACNNVPSGDSTAQGWAVDNGDTTVQIGSQNYTGLLTGLGTAAVECTSNWQTNSPYLRTGTAMLGITPPTVNGAAEPVTISAQLQGEGYNAVAFGLLL
jgi:prepilin-type N-terminal cleavage/methylation domain-containing protein